MFSASSLSPAQAWQVHNKVPKDPKDRVLVSDVETGDFFGYDTNNLNRCSSSAHSQTFYRRQ